MAMLMTFPFLHIVWDFDPEMISVFGLELRWYGLMFALAFIFGHFILRWTYQKEQKPLVDMDTLTVFVIIGVVVGARLGHILFYDPHYYFLDVFERYSASQSGLKVPDAPDSWFSAFIQTVIRIINVREGGLASHGATIGIITAVYLFSRKRPDQPFLWAADRLALTAACGAVCVRLGNFFNSEICGLKTNLPWAIEYVQASGSDCAGGPRHPTQLYEAISYLLIFGLLVFLYRKQYEKTPHGLLTGVLLITVFSARLLIEFVKENQEAYATFLPLNTGQLLSLPFIAFGVYLILRKKQTPETLA